MTNKIIKKLFLFFLIFNICNSAFSDNTYFIDFSKVLNQSQAGAEAQEKLKKRFNSENEKFVKEEENIKKKEAELISQKKVLSNEDYKNKVDDLRKQVTILQTNKQNSLNKIAQSRAKAKQILLKSLNPIIKKYMEENKIRLVIDKQSVILGDSTLEITDKIIEKLNLELKSIQID